MELVLEKQIDYTHSRPNQNLRINDVIFITNTNSVGRMFNTLPGFQVWKHIPVCARRIKSGEASRWFFGNEAVYGFRVKSLKCKNIVSK